MEFIFELISWSAGTGALGATTLDHEVSDDSVKLQSVVIVLAAKRLKILDGLGGLVSEQLDTNCSFSSIEGSDFS